jgi:hypothetical protein
METDVERGRRLGRKYILAGFVTLASVFVVLTTLEITEGVFGSAAHGIASAAPPSEAEGACPDDLRGLSAAVERAMTAASRLRDGEEATSRYREALLPEWTKEAAIETQCAGAPGGADAFATVVRLRIAGEALARRQAGELGPIRQTLAAYLGH